MSASGLRGKAVLVTGGASGIGAATATALTERGSTVVVADLNDIAGEALVDELGPPHQFVPLDVSDPASWSSAVERIGNDLGGLDVVMLNAGVMTRPAGEPILEDPLPHITPASMERIVGVNIAGVVLGAVTCAPLLEARGGTLLMTSSAAGVTAYPNDPLYAMTKHAVIGFGTSLAGVLERRGVRVVVVCPHGIDTPMCPPDLRAKKEAEGSFSPPARMAADILEILARASSGEIWVGDGSSASPWRYVPAPLSPPVTADS